VKIFEKMDSIDFSDSEKDRIGTCLLDSQSLQYRVLTSKAVAIRDYDFWRRAQKQFRVIGFRDGHPKAVQMVLTRALEAQKPHAGRNRHAGWPLLWPLYVRSVHLYLQDEVPNLSALLKREDYLASPGTLTEQILRCVVKCLPLHEATVDQVRELYELWGFERTKYADELLSNASVEADAVRRMIDDRVGTMRREIASAIATTRSDLLRHVEQQTTEIASLKNLLHRTRNDLDDARVRIPSAVAGTETKVNEPTVPTPAHRGRVPVQVTVKQQGSDRALPAIEALQTRVESLGRQFKELRHRLELLEPEDAPTVKTTLVQASTTTALQTIAKWAQAFDEVGVPSTSIGASWILLEVIRRSRVILTDKPQLLLSLIAALPAGESRCVVASPMWVTESDWKDALGFISEDVGVPRVLVVMDFDVGLQETYLVPALTGWASGSGPQSGNRVVLVPSDSELAAVSPRVFELATLATHSAPYVRDLKRLGGAISDTPSTLELPQAAATIIGYTRSKNVPYEDHLRQYATNYGVSVPPRVLENFVSLYEGLRSSLSARDAGYIAQEASLIPWVECACGEAVSRTLQEALKRLDGD
jgi:hypothetical protein